jgi:methyl-accepting chemotaxis protein
MIRTRPRTLMAVILVIASSIPSATFAQSARPATAPGDSPIENMNAQDREALAAAEQLASDGAQTIEQWIIGHGMTEERVFSRLYFPIPKTDPQKYTTPYEALAARDLVGPEDKALARSPSFQYAIITDVNGYVPAHNTRFAQPLTGKSAEDYVNNRTKRILADIPSLMAARSVARYLVQRTKVETGDVIYDVSVPVIVRGKHWGCARIGYRRIE